jgi:hypothetical protein
VAVWGGEVVGLSDRVAAVVKWLRAGYPEGLPGHDYVALLAILRRRLSDDEVGAVAETLVCESDVSQEAMAEAITSVTHQSPSEEDLARVSERLAAGGWPADSEWQSSSV